MKEAGSAENTEPIIQGAGGDAGRGRAWSGDLSLMLPYFTGWEAQWLDSRRASESQRAPIYSCAGALPGPGFRGL